ncbi:MAG: division/cell wall cluster transcriptional repressor MraZ [Acidimicrobiales bacterium]
MFLGTFEHSLDDKGRVVLPSAFRSSLADTGVLAKLDDCIGLWTPEEFAKVAAVLQEKVREGQVSADALRVFAADAATVRPDSQGRISIPQRLRDHSGLDRDLVINGRIDRIELWSVEKWAAVTTNADSKLASAVSVLGL